MKKLLCLFLTFLMFMSFSQEALAEGYNITIGSSNGYSGTGYVPGGGNVGNFPNCEGFAVTIIEDKWEGGIKHVLETNHRSYEATIRNGYSYMYPGMDANYYYRTFFLFNDARAGEVSKIKEYLHGREYTAASSRITRLPGRQSGYEYHPIEQKLIDKIKLGNEGWKYIKSHWKTEFAISYSDATWMWNYILRGSNQGVGTGTDRNGLNDRIRRQLHAELSDQCMSGSSFGSIESRSTGMSANEIKCRAAYLELMIALYNATPDGGNRARYEWSINALIDGGQEIDEYPPMFEIEPICFSYGGEGAVGMCAIDYLEKLSGTTASNNARTWTTGTYINENGSTVNFNGYDAYGLICTAATKAIKEQPNANRIASTYNGNNQYQAAERGNFGRRIRTNSNGCYTNQFQSNERKFQSLSLDNGSMWGSYLVMTIGGSKREDAGGRQDIEADKPSEEIIPSMQDVIGKDVEVTLETKQSDEIISDWENSKTYKEDNADIPYRYEFSYRVDVTYESNKRPASSMEVLGPPESTEEDYPNNACIGENSREGKEITHEELMQWMKGNKILKLMHHTAQQEIDNEETIRFNYESHVYIRKIKADGSVDMDVPGAENGYYELTPDDGLAYKQFTRDKKHLVYRSVPQAYAEIKADEPENEKWEAMAGVPTTERMYFAAGGSEFAVDVELQYDVVTTPRKFKIEYKADIEHCDLYKTLGHIYICPGHSDGDGGTYHCGGEHGCQGAEPCANSKHHACNEECTLHDFTHSWTQNVKFERIKILNCKVWQIKQSKVNGMNELVAIHETDNPDVLTTEQRGDEPTFYFHVASSEDCKGDRLRYTFMPDGTGYDDGHLKSNDPDDITWEYKLSESPAPHCWSDVGSWSAEVTEKHKSQTNMAYVESDSLILQTTGGDQVVFYFDAKTNQARIDSPITTPIVGEDGMWWDNNKTSASTWDPFHINKASYNGNYSQPSACFTPTGDHKLFNGMTFNGETVMEHFYNTLGIGSSDLLRPERPSDRLMMWRDFNNKLTYQNGEYDVGHSDIFYEQVVSYSEGGGQGYSQWDTKYSPTREGVNNYGTTNGIIVDAKYSEEHEDINNIVIHDPVSSEYAKVLSLPKERDQRVRSDEQRNLAQNILDHYNAEMVGKPEYIDNPNYHNNIVFNPGAEYKTSVIQDMPLGWKTSVTAENTFELKRTIQGIINSPLVDNNGEEQSSTASFKIKSNGAGQAMFYQDIDVIPGNTYKLTGDIVSRDSSISGTLAVYFKGFCNLDGSRTDGYINDSYAATKYIKNDSRQVSMEFTVPDNVSTISLGLVGISNGAGSVVFDNIILINKTSCGFIPNTRKVYDLKEVDNPKYHKHDSNCTCTREYIGLGEPNVDSNGDGKIDSNDMHVDIPGVTPYREIWSCGKVDNSIEQFVDTIKDFTYTGGVQTFIAPATGDYTFACRGANGGDSLTYRGGKGSVSYGTYHLEKGQAVYIYVGGRGKKATQEFISQREQYKLDHPFDEDYWDSIRDRYINYHHWREARDRAYEKWLYKVNLRSDELVNDSMQVAVNNDGGFNGGANSTKYTGSGGGATDVRIGLADVNDTSDRRIVVAGGGGGATRNAAGGDAGDNLDNSHNLYKGEMPTVVRESGGGGGYRGGDPGKGGSNFVGNGATQADAIELNETTDGNGIVRVYFKNTIEVEQPRINVETLSEIQYDNTVPDIATIRVEEHDGKVQKNEEADCFINIDYGFQIYFPNKGDFFQTTKHGIAECTPERSDPDTSDDSGGYIDNMNTTLWTKQKYVQFPVNVMYEGEVYIAGEKIYLPVNEEYFDFYCLLANYEQAKAKVNFVALAINNSGYSIETDANNNSATWTGEENGDDFKPYISGEGSLDNNRPINKKRASMTLAAKHSAIKEYFIDVVGRIGDYMIQDVGDPRFATFFKQANTPDKGWLIENIIPTVDESKQNKIVGHSVDIRDISTGDDNTDSMREWMFDYPKFKEGSYSTGKDFDTKGVYGGATNESNFHLDTHNIHGLFANQVPYNFPLTPSYIPIDALKKQPLRLGYPVYQDIQTIGNYAVGTMQILPYYYYYNFEDNSITPVDVYMKENNNYVPINLFGKANQVTTEKSEEAIRDNKWIYNNRQYIDWQNENVRRNTPESSTEWQDTIRVAQQIAAESCDGVIAYNEDNADNPVYVDIPHGMYYSFGNNQIMKLNGRCRTFAGSVYTYGNYMNKGERIAPDVYMLQNQRWHFTNTLPSTTVIVQKGKKVNTNNILEMKNEKGVILAALDIKAIGNVWTLQNDAGGNNTDFEFAGRKYPIPPDIVKQKVYTIISTNKSSSDDMDVSGTH